MCASPSLPENIFVDVNSTSTCLYADKQKKKLFRLDVRIMKIKFFLCACLDAQNNCDAQNNYLSENWNFLFMFYYCLCLIFHEHVNKHLSTKKNFLSFSHRVYGSNANVKLSEEKCWKQIARGKVENDIGKIHML